MTKNSNKNSKTCRTGIKGLDQILHGGLPEHSLYSIQGEPGTGKTTFALQFLIEGLRHKEPGLYITFSETKAELERVASSHGWDISQIKIMDLSSLEDQFDPSAQTSLFHPFEVELKEVFKLVLDKIDEVKPDRIVFDSVSEMRLLAETPLRYRRQILALKQALANRKITVLFLDDLTVGTQDLQIHSIAHGVVHLSRIQHEYGAERRKIKVIKLRGVDFVGGYHDMDIATGGIQVYPRMLSAQHSKESAPGSVSSDNEAFDLMLGGGLDRGTANLFVGPAGSGKSNIILRYAMSAIAKGEKVAYFCFDETLANFMKRAKGLSVPVEKPIKDGLLRLQKVDPAELAPGAFAHLILNLVCEEDYKVIIIDSLNGYIQAMPQESFLTLQLHELLAFLNNQGVLTIMSLAQAGIFGNMVSPVDLTYLADTVLLTRFFEYDGEVRKAISVVKKRTGFHEKTIREFSFDSSGLYMGPELREFEGVLTGVARQKSKG